jgi:hypothetical protein
MTEDEIQDHPPDPEDLEALTSWEPPPKPGSLVGLLPNKWIRRLVLGAIPLLAIAFGSGLIAVSQLGVTQALQIFGAAEGGKPTTLKQLRAGKVRAELVSDRRNALRIAVWNRIRKKHERHFKAKLVLQGYGIKSPTLFTGRAGPGYALDANFTLPRLRPGYYKLKVTASRADRKFSATLPVKIVAPPAKLPLVLTDPPKKGVGTKNVSTPPGPDGVLFDILPAAGRSVSSELIERMTVRTTDSTGIPVQVQFDIKLKGGMLYQARPGMLVVKPTRTDALGLYDFKILSRRLTMSLEASYKAKGGQTATTTVNFSQRPSQAAILPDRLVVKPGAELGVNVQTKSRSGHVYLEGLRGGRRFQVASKAIEGGVARFRIVVPRQPGLFRLQATDDFANPGKGIASRSLFVDAAEPSDLRWLVHLAQAVKTHLGPEHKRTHAHLDALLRSGKLTGNKVQSGRTAAYLLSRLDHRHYPTAWVADTSAADAGTLKRRRKRLQTYMLLGLAFTALLLLAVVLPLIYTNILLHREGAAERDALMTEFEGEVADGRSRESWHDGDSDWRDEEELSPKQKARRAAQAEKLSRVQHVVQIVAVTGVIILALAMVLILLLNLTWSLQY